MSYYKKCRGEGGIDHVLWRRAEGMMEGKAGRSSEIFHILSPKRADTKDCVEKWIGTYWKHAGTPDGGHRKGALEQFRSQEDE